MRGGDRVVAHEMEPVEQQIVVVEHRPRRLGVDVGREQRPQGLLPFEAPGEGGLEAGAQGRLGVHRARVDREAGPLARKAPVGTRESLVVAEAIEEIGGVLAIEQRERGVQPRLRRVVAEEAVRDRVEGARPGQRRAPRWGRGAAMRAARRVISWAARRENVSRRMRRGSAPRATSAATRWARVCVLPVPAPATIRRGPSPAEAARRWAGLRGSAGATEPRLY